ncbi:PAS domain S-box protein [Spirosoma agri]|uniref:histidine kinase n=1 Tax=Spirosoma agri TaxID=1987381 RepID=A0A6M0ISR8_9BACT|nr:ATP-binding protein [Spirosoma agri]NEU70133.1 PAS domain S-box protein [Spirosoma agri]
MAGEHKPFDQNTNAELERLQNTLLNAGIGTWELDFDQWLIKWDDQCQALFGLSDNKTITYEQLLVLIHPDDRQQVDESFQRLTVASSTANLTLRFRTNETTGEQWIRMIGKAKANPDNAPMQLSGVALAIVGEHRRPQPADNPFSEGEAKLRSLIESAPFPIGVYSGPEMTIQFANQSILDVWGKGNDVIGKKYSDILPELSNQLIYDQLDRVYRTGIAFHARNQRVDIVIAGRLQSFYFNYSFTPLYDADGQVYGVMNTAAEITDLIRAKQDLEKSEKNLRGAIELAELATWSLDIQTNTFHYSDRFMDWLGFSNDTADLDEAYNPLPIDFRDAVVSAINLAIQPGSSGHYENEHPIINRLTNRTRIIHAQAQVFYDAKGQPALLSGTAQDVTMQRHVQLALEQLVQERTEELEATNEELSATNEELAASNEELTASSEEIVAANEQLEESNQNLTRSNQNLEQFAYIASHDLQEPLRKIQQFCDLLKTRFATGGEELIYIDRMQIAAGRMSLLIRDLLTFSRISIRQVTATPVALDHLVKDVLENLSVAIDESQAVVQVGILPVVPGDDLQLNQLVQNLLSNALKFRRTDRNPHIQINATDVLASELPPAVKPARQADAYYRIDVTDNGIGFEEKYLDRIFQVFQRLHGRNEFAGTGVGLAICQKVVTNHGGAITASSRPGQGTTFSVYLPI